MSHTEDHADATMTPPDELSGEPTIDAPGDTRPPGRRRRLVLWVILLIAFTVVFYRPPAGQALGWGTDLDGALTQAKASGRLVMVAFDGAHCPPCAVMARTVLGAPAVHEALEDFVPVQIEIEQHMDVALRYQIYATPTYAVLTSDGRVVNQIMGSRTVADFVAFLETSRAMADTTPSSPPQPGV